MTTQLLAEHGFSVFKGNYCMNWNGPAEPTSFRWMAEKHGYNYEPTDCAH